MVLLLPLYVYNENLMNVKALCCQTSAKIQCQNNETTESYYHFSK